MQHHLKFVYSLVFILLLSTSCQKEALLIPDQPAPVAATSGRSRSGSPPSSRSRSGSTASQDGLSKSSGSVRSTSPANSDRKNNSGVTEITHFSSKNVKYDKNGKQTREINTSGFIVLKKDGRYSKNTMTSEKGKTENGTSASQYPS